MTHQEGLRAYGPGLLLIKESFDVVQGAEVHRHGELPEALVGLLKLCV